MGVKATRFDTTTSHDIPLAITTVLAETFFRQVQAVYWKCQWWQVMFLMQAWVEEVCHSMWILQEREMLKC